MTAPISAQRDHVLLVDDDAELLVFLADRLRRDGFRVTTARSGPEAITRMEAECPDTVVLDLMMPGMDGEELANQIKRRADVPVIVLSVVTAGETKVDMIDRYADDFVTKPFDYAELRARIRRVLHRSMGRIPDREIHLGPDLRLLLKRREAWVADRRVSLSRTETRLLSALVARLGQTVSTDELVARCWTEVEGANASYVWVSLRRLRQKIELDPDNPRYLVTDRRLGYRLVQLG